MAVEPTIPEPDMVRQRLAGLREQRKAQRQTQAEITERTRAAVRDAQEVGVPIAEIARLLDMDRSSVYRTYVQPV